ncbi:MAG: GNAT family N-acetyltransferase [Ardenticatenaceae bacterium]
MAEIRYVPIQLEHVHCVKRVLDRCFPDMLPTEQYSIEELEELADIFAEGTIIALDGDKVVAMSTGSFVDLDFDNLPPREHDLLYDENGVSTHTPDGEYYYGSDIGVDPAYRGRGIARQLYNRRKALVRRYNKRGFVAAGVLPGYEKHWDQMDIHTYVDKVIAGELFDPTLTVQLRNGFEVRGLIKDFYIFPRSRNWSTLIVWDNPDYQDEELPR